MQDMCAVVSLFLASATLPLVELARLGYAISARLLNPTVGA